MTQQNQQPTELHVRQVVERIVASKGFANSPRLAEFLRYVAEQTLSGRASDIKEYNVGISVYRKDPNYNPSTDSTVRTEASRLRSRMQAYYEGEGAAETVRITMPKGGYALRWDEPPVPAPAPAVPASPSEAATPPAAESQQRKSRFPAWILPAVSASVITGAILWWTTSLSTPPPPAARIRPFTAFHGGEYEPTFSPNGQQIAFTWNGPSEDNFDIYLMGLNETQPTRLTDHPGGDGSIAWSPDGKEIAFIRISDGGLYIVDIATRKERRVSVTKLTGALHDRHLDWSPDGRSLAIADRDAEGQPFVIEILDLATGHRRRITSPSGQTLGDTGPAFSHDGKTIAFRRALSDAVREIHLVPFGGGPPVALTNDRRHIPAHAWEPGSRSLLFVSNREGATGLWRIEPKPGAVPTGPLPFGQDAYYVAVARNASRIAYTVNIQETSIWRLPVKNPPLAEPLISSTRRDTSPRHSPDGTRIAFRSERSGSHEIWLWSDKGKSIKPLTHFGGPLTGSPRWSPDGTRLVFDSRPNGNSDIFTIPAEGGEPVRVTTSTADDVLGCYSVDGRWLYFASNRSGTWQVWKLPVGVTESAQNEAKQVTANGGFAPQAAPGGTEIYYAKGRDEPGVWRVPVNGGQERPVLPQKTPGSWGWWGPLGGSIYYMAPAVAGGGYTLEQLMPGGQSRSLGSLAQRPMPWDSGFSVSPDGESILFTNLQREGSDLMLAEQD